MPHAIFSSPQVAAVGFIEQEKKKKNNKIKIKNNSIDYVKSVYPYINAAMGWALEDKCGETLWF